ncbi:transposable element Tcb1 transposase [Trichonephila clavipes]|uniref:Transposable element Tcb1 transposase n=1 Tax=Trichonephila clavipes TaxID=2585209 RepID=A0A8X6WE39_TRICX|nr:transposable element Tcb1 transposase [Trichonephila clavipes]
MQEEMTERRDRSHPPRCTAARDDRRIVYMAVMERSATSRTITQQMQSVTHQLLSTGTIRHSLRQSGMSAKRPYLWLPLTGNHRCFSHQWCDEWWPWTTKWNYIVFTDESHFCLKHRDGRIRV